MTPRPVRTSIGVGETALHLHQVVRDETGRDWIVVSLDGGVTLDSAAFDAERTLSADEFAVGGFEPLSADGVPVWGY